MIVGHGAQHGNALSPRLVSLELTHREISCLEDRSPPCLPVVIFPLRSIHLSHVLYVHIILYKLTFYTLHFIMCRFYCIYKKYIHLQIVNTRCISFFA